MFAQLYFLISKNGKEKRNVCAIVLDFTKTFTCLVAFFKKGD